MRQFILCQLGVHPPFYLLYLHYRVLAGKQVIFSVLHAPAGFHFTFGFPSFVQHCWNSVSMFSSFRVLHYENECMHTQKRHCCNRHYFYLDLQTHSSHCCSAVKIDKYISANLQPFLVMYVLIPHSLHMFRDCKVPPDAPRCCDVHFSQQNTGFGYKNIFFFFFFFFYSTLKVFWMWSVYSEGGTLSHHIMASPYTWL